VALLGDRGTGKTQLAVEVIRSQCNDLESALYTRAIEMFIAVRECYRKDASAKESDVINRYVRPHLLVIDEAHERGHTDAENRILTLIIDRRYGDRKPTILIANSKPDAFREQIGESIFDRLVETGGIKVCDWPSFRVRKP
jgi:DNA replication protein DnaC